MVLERFNVPDEKAVLVPVDSMRAVVHELFLACGLDQDGAHGSLRPRLPVMLPASVVGPPPRTVLPLVAGAATCADVLIANDLRGNESHGVSNQLRAYVTGFQRGEPRPASGPTDSLQLSLGLVSATLHCTFALLSAVYLPAVSSD